MGIKYATQFTKESNQGRYDTNKEVPNKANIEPISNLVNRFDQTFGEGTVSYQLSTKTTMCSTFAKPGSILHFSSA